MNVLLAYASRHGSTREIAEGIVEEIRRQKIAIDLKDVRDVESIEAYDAVVLGSAVYVGQWQKEARAFIDRFEDELRDRTVFLFTSGPIGDDPFPKDDPPETPELLSKTGAVEHRSFLGKLDRANLGVGERIITRVVRAPEGDFRDWEEVRAWARDVAHRLQEVAKVPTGTA